MNLHFPEPEPRNVSVSVNPSTAEPPEDIDAAINAFVSSEIQGGDGCDSDEDGDEAVLWQTHE